MIGQDELKILFNMMLSNKRMPHFIIFAGAIGSGRKTFIKEVIAPVFADKTIWVESNSTDSMRRVVQEAYEKHGTLFILTNTDTMRPSAKNALLKVVEECPNDNYFILTIENPENTLATLRSRAALFWMAPYSSDELLDYAKSKYIDIMGWEERAAITSICENPGDVDILMTYNVHDFMAYVNLVFENIGRVSGSNAFKISEKIALQDDSDGYNLKLFFRAYMSICLKKLKENPEFGAFCARAIRYTSRCMSDLYITGIHRQAMFDMWVLDIRQAWLDLV